MTTVDVDDVIEVTDVSDRPGVNAWPIARLQELLHQIAQESGHSSADLDEAYRKAFGTDGQEDETDSDDDTNAWARTDRQHYLILPKNAP